MNSIRGSGFYTINDQEWVRYIPSHPGDAREECYFVLDALFTGIGLVALGAVWDWKRL